MMSEKTARPDKSREGEYIPRDAPTDSVLRDTHLSQEQKLKLFEIKQCWRNSVQGIMNVGHRLRQFESDPDWEYVFRHKLLPFEKRTARRLMRIAESWLRGVDYACLPASYGTLDMLARLPATRGETYIADGAIHPEITRGDAAKLVKPENSTRTQVSKVNPTSEQRAVAAEVRRSLDKESDTCPRCGLRYSEIDAAKRMSRTE